MGVYASVLRDRDNFIYAAIKANDSFMQNYWLGRAKVENDKLKELNKKPIKEIE